MMRLISAVLMLLGAGGCASSLPSLPAGQAAYATLPDAPPGQVDYRIGPLDVVSITVFQEPDLSLKEVPVDANGQVLMPLVGAIQAAGKTASELSDEVRQRLRRNYLVNPQVTASVVTSSQQRVVVEGSVVEPGVYPVRGRATLSEALALAKGPTSTARLNEAIIFRQVDGKQMAARFDLRAIRRGEAADPQIVGGDRVVMGFSGVKQAWRDVLSAAPLLTPFVLLF